MKGSWEEQLRRKLEGHKVAPPEGLWEDICKELDVRDHSTNRRWYYAAAALLAVAGFFAVYQLNNNNETKELTVKSEMIAPEKPDTPASEDKVDDKLALASINHKVSKEDNLTKCQTPCDLEPSAPEPEPESDDDLNKDVLQESDSEEPVTEPQPKKPVDDPRTYQLPSSEPSPKRNETSDRWSLGLTASGGLLAANNSVNTNLLYYKNVNSIDYAFYGITSQFSNAQTEFVWKHRLPLRFGLSVHYQLNDRLSLLSGISYTYLYTECSIPLYNINYNQKLHYLGIPIGMVWQLWSSGHFRLYLSGSAMLEKCINASFDYKSSDGVDIEKPWQWSLNAAAGAEYSFTPQLGVYLEPSLGYYFDDGSNLEHYYKEHPLAPSISFGLRFNLNPR
ncbi:MAG: outer membrane beta-barrel protein [Prevotella sp.]|nr:outer membrane beta-barrel protein [Prevotella sp.]